MLTLRLSLCALVIASSSCSHPEAPASSPPPGIAPATSATTKVDPSAKAGQYVTENYYYAKPGLADEVYATRVRASNAIAALGMPNGVIFRGPGGDGPDVIWQGAPYSSPDDLKPFNEKLRADPDFKAAYQHMDALLRRFERRRYQVVSAEADITN
jgi:hypothetical protein